MSHFKKQIILYFMLTILLVSFLPAMNYYHNSKETSLKKLFNIDILESYRNYFFYKYFHRSLNNNDVIVGNNGYIYLGNKHNYLLSKTQDLSPFSIRSIKKWTNNLKKLQLWYENQGIKFVLVVVPNKHSVYPEHLPEWVVEKNSNLTYRMIESAQNKGINLLNLKADFLSEKLKNNELYYKTDSHWNGIGAGIGLSSLVDYLNNLYSLNINLPHYTFLNKKTQGLGNARLLKMHTLLPLATEVKKSFSFSRKTKICHGEINIKTLNLKKCIFDKNKPYDIHKGAHYFINPHAMSKLKILFLGDSFADTQTRLLNKVFNTRWLFHYNKITQNEIQMFIKENKPDIVIYQVVERSLYNNKFIGY